MASVAIERKKYSLEEYLALDAASESRLEFHDGDVIAMAGGTFNHNFIAQNLLLTIRQFFNEKGCYVFMENVRLDIEHLNKYYYPDILLTCDEEDLESTKNVKNPVLIAEVISESTFKIDTKKKLKDYMLLRSLRYYIIVYQEDMYIEVFSRKTHTAVWTYQAFSESDELIELEELHFTFKVNEIYRNVKF